MRSRSLASAGMVRGIGCGWTRGIGLSRRIAGRPPVPCRASRYGCVSRPGRPSARLMTGVREKRCRPADDRRAATPASSSTRRNRPQPLLQRAAAERRARLRLLDRQRHLGRGLMRAPRRCSPRSDRDPAPAVYAGGWRRCAAGSGAPMASPGRRDRLRAVRHRPRICRSRAASPAARRAAPTTSCSAPTRSAAAASIRPTASISPRDRARRRDGAGRAGARPRRTHVEMIDIPVRDRMGRVRPSTDIAARMDGLDRRRRAAGGRTASSMSSTARRPA
jgi:hypothetical protein